MEESPVTSKLNDIHPSDDESNIGDQPDLDNTNTIQITESKEQTKSKYKYGVIYFSYIPDGLNVKLLRELMEEFGEVGRIYLEPEENNRKKYVEGWVEFKKKRVAKEVAAKLNGTTLQHGRKRSRINGQIWSIKYLHKFKWAHLTEQLVHDAAVKEQKRRFEMSQTKKQVDFYQKMTQRSKFMRNKNHHQTQNSSEKAQSLETKQKNPVRQGNELAVPVDEDFLSSIFKKVT